MAGPASNFDAEIKKGMTGPKAKSSDGGTPTKASPSSNKQNQWNQSKGPVGKAGKANGDPDAAADRSGVGDLDTAPLGAPDTHAAMIAAGHAHMQAIHNHIQAISSGKGGGGLAPVNAGTKA